MDWNKLQREHQEWSLRNFGDRGPLQGALGILEEVGELVYAIEVDDTLEVLDAVGDIALFGVEYASKRGWEMQAVVDLKHRSPYPLIRPRAGIQVCAGRIAHAELKLWQGIRLDEGHVERARESTSELFGHLDRFTRAWFPDTFEKIVEKTWTIVRERDWVAERAAKEAKDG